MSTKKKAIALVYVVDGDRSCRERIDRLIRGSGYQTSVFDSSEAFLRPYHDRTIGCLILNAQLPGVSGLRLQGLLADAHIAIPIVFVTESPDVVRPQAFAKGAVAVLATPFTDEDLLRAITSALATRKSIEYRRGVGE